MILGKIEFAPADRLTINRPLRFAGQRQHADALAAPVLALEVEYGALEWVTGKTPPVTRLLGDAYRDAKALLEGADVKKYSPL